MEIDQKTRIEKSINQPYVFKYLICTNEEKSHFIWARRVREFKINAVGANC